VETEQAESESGKGFNIIFRCRKERRQSKM